MAVVGKSQRLSSTTTRIKTATSYCPSIEGRTGQRLSSTTTRIKTEGRFCRISHHRKSETIFHYNKD